MIYTGLNRTGEIETVKANGGAEVAEVYGEIGESNPIYYKQREMVGTSPMQFKALGIPLKDYRIYGETRQDGTPSPDMPVDVVGCGVRTANLFDIDNASENYYLNNGVPTSYNIGGYVLSDYIPIASNAATISAKRTLVSDFGAHWAVYDENKTFIRGGIAFTARYEHYVKVLDTSGAAFIRVDYATEAFTDCMLNLGSTALSYEPYGYKLPLTVNGTEYPIYLGQVETTRRIKKMVFDGTENWELNNNKLMFARTTTEAIPYESTVCTHYIGARSFAEVINTTKSIAVINVGIYVNSGSTDVANFKSYLAAQYAAGTPVTIWYVLTESETGIVNEPLMKIDDYADTISFAQAGVTIPTVAGTNTLTVDTTIKPSEIDLTGRLKASGYGQLLDKNSTSINDSTGTPIFIRG